MYKVAKPYQAYEQIGQAYTRDGLNYIKVKTDDGVEKEVRLYTNAEYNFLLGMQAQKNKELEQRRKVAQSYNEERKINAGFEKGYIVTIIGNTYPKREQLKKYGAIFSNIFLWHFKGGDEPRQAKTLLGFELRKLTWEEVSHKNEVGATILKPTNEIKKMLESITDVDDDTEYLKDIGEEVKGIGVITSRKILGYKHRINVLYVVDIKGHDIVFNGSIGEMLEEGDIIHLSGTVEKHNVFQGRKQTVLGSTEVTYLAQLS